ncbi:MAG: HEPN domain-containing protein [Thermodesulfobacteriota bacterium]
MSIEIILYPKKARRDDLRDLLVSCGFKPCQHLWDWPKGSLNYWWFDSHDYRSFDGVEATIFKPSEAEQKYGLCEWALHTRTRSSASLADQEQQNAVIRAGRKKFGGSFYNDWYGKNRYTQVEVDPRDPVGRGIYLAYEFVRQNLRAVRYALPDPTESLDKLEGTKLESLSTSDPMRVLYNALVPFVVAALEHFFSQCFKILLQYEPKARVRLQQQSRKVDLSDVLAIQAGTKTIEDVVADWYSFQNIASIQSAFSDWFGIDFWKLLRRRKRIGRRIKLLESYFNRLIEFRHGIIHRLSLDLELRKPQIEQILDLAVVLIDTFVDHLETDRGKTIRD